MKDTLRQNQSLTNVRVTVLSFRTRAMHVRLRPFAFSRVKADLVMCTKKSIARALVSYLPAELVTVFASRIRSFVCFLSAVCRIRNFGLSTDAWQDTE